MQLRFAEPGDIESITSLWSKCFPGDEDFCDFFMAELFEPTNTFVYEDAGRIVSMAHILPMEMEYHFNIIPAGYIFAVGTDPDYRAKGLAGAIMERILDELRRREIPLAFLVPQKDSLFTYYQRYGFADVFSLSHIRLIRDKLPQDKLLTNYALRHSYIKELGPEDTALEDCCPSQKEVEAADGIFENVMRYRNHLLRSTEHWKRAVKIGEISGGGMFTVSVDGEMTGYALCERVGDELLINELLAEDEASYNTLCTEVLTQMHASEATLLAAACPHDAKRFGMARVVDAQKMLSYAAEYRGNMAGAFVVQDPQAPWNSGRYEIDGAEVRRSESGGSRAAITAGQLTEILFGAGPMPYINMLFS